MSVLETLEPSAKATPSFAPPLDDEPLFEIVDGRQVEIPRMGALAGYFASDLMALLNHFAKRQNLGQAVVEVLFRLALPVERNRRPDVAFVSYQRWPKDKMEGLDQNAWDVTPNLAVEVISKHDEVEALVDKIDEYFRAGVQLVWVMMPKKSLVYVYESFTKMRILTRNDTLDGGTVLPGFSLSLQEFFPATLEQLPQSADPDE